MKRKLIMVKGVLSIVAFFLLTSLFAQTRKISGTVLSEEDNSPLQGVTISLKGKKNLTQTLLNGTYTIQASKGDVIVFSYSGFSNQEIKVGDNNQISLKLKPDVSNLNDVIVVGYGTQSRRNVTSSIGKVDNQVLETVPRSNIGTALQGTVAGVQVVNTTGSPGATPTILLRGGASINNPGSPLVVVDGIIRAYNDIPAEDVASITLLKDAAATAIYGARANNGVILITTKTGKVGSSQVSYKFTEGYNKRREGYDYMNAHDYIYYNRLGGLNSGRTLAAVNGTRGYGLQTDPANLASFDIRSYTGNESLLTRGWDTVGDPYGGIIIFKDHSKEVENLVFRNTMTQDHYVNVTGGNEKGKYFASFDYYNEDGVIVGSNYKRYSGNINGSYKIKPNLEITTAVTFSNASQLGVAPNSGEINTIYRSLAIWPTFNPWLDSAKTLPNPGNGNADGNPLYPLSKLQRTSDISRFTVSASAKYDFSRELYLKVSASEYFFESLAQSFQSATQTYAQIYSTPPTFSTTRDAIMTLNRTFQQQYTATLNYTKTFRQNHHLNAQVGVEYFGQKNLTLQVDGQSAPTDYIPTANASTVFPAGGNTSSKSAYAIASNFGNVLYDYANKYLLQLVYRIDAVSSLASENRVGLFPGVTGGWNVHNENFFKNSGISKYISLLKPRIGYGVNGNVSGIGNYDVQGVYGSQGNYNGLGGYLNTSIVNSNLKWEQSKTTNFGIDMGILHNRITLMADVFDRRTSNLLTNLTLPSYLGFSTVRTNLGTLQNKGVELTLSASIIRNKDFSWDVSANASFVKNKILQLPYNGNDKNRQGGIQVWDPNSKQLIWVGGLQEGQAIGDLYAFKQLSIFKDAAEVGAVAGNRVDKIGSITGPNLPAGAGGHITPGDVNWLDVDRNDTIDSRDQVYMGNINPKVTGGISSNLSYKNFSVYVVFDYALGHTIYNDLVARTLGQYQGSFNYITLQKNAWSPTNTVTDIPKVYYADQVLGDKNNYTRSNNAASVPNSNNSRFYEKGDYMACREITLSYNFSKALLAKTKIFSQARIFASGYNLFYITKFSGFSPEPPSQGVYAGTYPTPRSFALGAQVSF